MIAARREISCRSISPARLAVNRNHRHGDRRCSAVSSGLLRVCKRAAAYCQPEIARSKTSDSLRHPVLDAACRLRAQYGTAWSRSGPARRQNASHPYCRTHPSILGAVSICCAKDPTAGSSAAVTAACARLRVQQARSQDRWSRWMGPPEDRVWAAVLPGCREGGARPPRPAADIKHMRSWAGSATKSGSTAICAAAIGGSSAPAACQRSVRRSRPRRLPPSASCNCGRSAPAPACVFFTATVGQRSSI